MQESIFGNIDAYRSDEKLETDGKPVELAPGITVWVRRAGGFNRRRWNAAVLQARGEIDEGHPEFMQEVEYLAAARVLVARWEGLEDREGEALSCTVDNVIALFREMPDWFELITTAAYEREGFRQSDATKSVRGSDPVGG